jgi:hypothetical protein
VSCSFQNRTKAGVVVFKSGQRVSKSGLKVFGLLWEIGEKKDGLGVGFWMVSDDGLMG